MVQSCIKHRAFASSQASSTKWLSFQPYSTFQNHLQLVCTLLLLPIRSSASVWRHPLPRVAYTISAWVSSWSCSQSQSEVKVHWVSHPDYQKPVPDSIWMKRTPARGLHYLLSYSTELALRALFTPCPLAELSSYPLANQSLPPQFRTTPLVSITYEDLSQQNVGYIPCEEFFIV